MNQHCPACAARGIIRPTKPIVGNRICCTALPGVCRWSGVAQMSGNPVHMHGGDRYFAMRRHDNLYYDSVAEHHPADPQRVHLTKDSVGAITDTRRPDDAHSHADQERRRRAQQAASAGSVLDEAPRYKDQERRRGERECDTCGDTGWYQRATGGGNHCDPEPCPDCDQREPLTCEFPDCHETHPTLLEGDAEGEGWTCDGHEYGQRDYCEQECQDTVACCTRPSGHEGDHIGWDQKRVLARWPQAPAEPKPLDLGALERAAEMLSKAKLPITAERALDRDSIVLRTTTGCGLTAVAEVSCEALHLSRHDKRGLARLLDKVVQELEQVVAAHDAAGDGGKR